MTTRTVLARSNGLPDEVDAIVTGIVDGRPVTYEVKLDLLVVQLPASFSGVNDEEIEHASLAEGHSVPVGGPYTVRYTYHGKRHEKSGLWGDENGQLVSRP